MEQHASFLLALPADPGGDTNRLVYADWLEEQGHPLAELLRLQVEIAGRPEDDPEVPALHERETAILQEEEWCFEALCARLAGNPEALRKLDEDVLGLSRRDPVALLCPMCGLELTHEFAWLKAAVLHWKLNPGLAVNELLLGQRLLRDGLGCAGCGYACVRCAACRRFPAQERFYRGFGHWLGLRCPDCRASVPMLENFVTAGVVGLGRLAVWGLSKLAKGRRQGF